MRIALAGGAVGAGLAAQLHGVLAAHAAQLRHGHLGGDRIAAEHAREARGRRLHLLRDRIAPLRGHGLARQKVDR